MQNMEAFCECSNHHCWWSPRGRMDDVLPYIHVRLPVSRPIIAKSLLIWSIFHIAVKSREINIFSSIFFSKIDNFFLFHIPER